MNGRTGRRQAMDKVIKSTTSPIDFQHGGYGNILDVFSSSQHEEFLNGIGFLLLILLYFSALYPHTFHSAIVKYRDSVRVMRSISKTSHHPHITSRNKSEGEEKESMEYNFSLLLYSR